MTPLIYAGLPDQDQRMFRLGVKKSTAPDILRVVTGYTGISYDIMRSGSRKVPIPETKQIAMKLIRERTKCTLKTIGEMFGTDHGTVIYSIRKITDLIETDQNIRNRFKQIEGRL